MLQLNLHTIISAIPNATHFDEKPAMLLVLPKLQGTPRCRRLRKACSTSLASEPGSIRQKLPLPGSSWLRGTLMKYRFSDRLCRIEF